MGWQGVVDGYSLVDPVVHTGITHIDVAIAHQIGPNSNHNNSGSHRIVVVVTDCMDGIVALGGMGGSIPTGPCFVRIVFGPRRSRRLNDDGVAPWGWYNTAVLPSCHSTRGVQKNATTTIHSVRKWYILLTTRLGDCFRSVAAATANAAAITTEMEQQQQ